MRRKKLGIISDTAVSETAEGVFLGYEPVVREIEYFLKYWETVEWLAYSQPSDKTVYSDPLPTEVKVKALKALGGKGLRAKLAIAIGYFDLFIQVYRVIRNSEDIHVRAPAHPALCAIFLAPLFPKKTFWFKYAGSWVDGAPKSYDLQRKLLKRISRDNIFTTVNGQWPDSNKNILPLENPCFTKAVREQMADSISHKEPFEGGLNLIYVGALTEFKGVHLVMQALENISFEGFNKLTIIGTGDYEQELHEKAVRSQYKRCFDFQGAKNKEQVFKCLKDSDLLIIASKSEGFPKVISEAMVNYCVPVSSRVSCIDQYIQKDIGFLIEERTVQGIQVALLSAVADQDLYQKKLNCRKLSAHFSYERYMQKLMKHVFLVRNK